MKTTLAGTDLKNWNVIIGKGGYSGKGDPEKGQEIWPIYSRHDARLIAAAPVTLESLKDILSRFQSCIGGGNGEIEGDKEAITKAENAIANAEGRRP